MELPVSPSGEGHDVAEQFATRHFPRPSVEATSEVLFSADLLEKIGFAALADHLPSALRLQRICTQARLALVRVQCAAAARRLRWMYGPAAIEISSNGRVLAAVQGFQSDLDETNDYQALSDGHDAMPLVVGSLLPTTRLSSWAVCVEHATHSIGYVEIGVCDTAGHHSWTVRLEDGWLLHRFQVPGEPEQGEPSPTPAGFPDVNHQDGNHIGVKVMNGLRGITDGKLIGVWMDHDAGTLGFRVDGGPPLVALQGFPPGAQLRLCALLWGRHDRARLATVWL